MESCAWEEDAVSNRETELYLSALQKGHCKTYTHESNVWINVSGIDSPCSGLTPASFLFLPLLNIFNLLL